MKNVKKAKSLVMIVAIMALLMNVLLVVVAESTPKITIDGDTVDIRGNNGTPFVDPQGRLQVPLRIISEKLGAKVKWDQASQTAVINDGIKVKVGSTDLITPTGKMVMDTTPLIKNNRLYIPLRYIGNVLGYTIESTTKGDKVSANIVTEVELTLSAAASLKDALNEIKALYLIAKPHTKLAINFGSSGALQQQIEQGAEVDLFFSASTSNMTQLKDKGLLDDTTITNLLGNKIVLVVPNDSKLTMDSFSDVTQSKVKTIALGEPTTVPAGTYANQVFTYLNILDQVKAKAVYGKDVKEVLTWVETGNVDAGVVYATDAKVSTKVKVIATASEASHKAIIYSVAVIKDSKKTEAAKDFLNFLASDAAKEVYIKYGFSLK